MNGNKPPPHIVVIHPRPKGNGNGGSNGGGNGNGHGSDDEERSIWTGLKIEAMRKNMATKEDIAGLKTDVANSRAESRKGFAIILLTILAGFASLVGGIVFFAIRGGFL